MSCTHKTRMACLRAQLGTKRLQRIGQGDQATVYSTSEPGLVAKVYDTRDQAEAFAKERVFARVASDARCAPCLHAVLECDCHAIGTIIMQRIQPLEMCETVQELPCAVQQQMLCTIQNTLKAGVLHGDAHPGNWGVCANGSLVLFDHGWSAQLPLLAEPPTEALFMAYTLYQVLEHCTIRADCVLGEALHASLALAKVKTQRQVYERVQSIVTSRVLPL